MLLSQTFVIDGETSVEKAAKNAEKDVGAPVAYRGFVRFELGEGIEKEEDDFAAEVAGGRGRLIRPWRIALSWAPARPGPISFGAKGHGMDYGC